MTSISALMIAEMKGQNRVHPTLEFQIGGGATLRFAEEAICSEGAGIYQRLIVDWGGGWKQPAGYGNYSLETPRMAVTVFDEKRTIQNGLGGMARKQLRGVTWSTTWRSFHVPASAHWTDFSGVIDDVDLSDNRTYRITLAPDTKGIDGLVKIPKLTLAGWPKAPSAQLGAPLWVVYGHMLSTLRAQINGRIACVPLDSSGKLWFYGMDDARAVQIWHTPSGGVETIRDDFTPVVVNGGDGLDYGCAFFASSPPAVVDAVRADVHGITGGATDVRQNPVSCLRHFLYSYGVAQGRFGIQSEKEVGLLDTAGLDAAEAFFDQRKIRAGFIVTNGETISGVLNSGCGQFGLIPYYTDAGLLSFRVDDPSETSIYLDNAHVVQALGHFLDDRLSGTTSRDQNFYEVSYSWGEKSLITRDPLGTIKRSGTRTYDMVDDSLVERY